MTDNWSQFASQMLHTRAVSETFRDGLTPERQADFDEAVRRFQGTLQDESNAVRIVAEIQRECELELNTRRKWASAIREEFGKYHEHEGGHPCGACGSIQAANWMDPDYSGDGPQS